MALMPRMNSRTGIILAHLALPLVVAMAGIGAVKAPESTHAESELRIEVRDDGDVRESLGRIQSDIESLKSLMFYSLFGASAAGAAGVWYRKQQDKKEPSK